MSHLILDNFKNLRDLIGQFSNLIVLTLQLWGTYT